MRTVYFIDTSILVNLLDVDGHNESVDAVQERFRELEDSTDEMMLPWAAIIETGNHIAQIKNGDRRRLCAQRFSAMLQDTIAERTPWGYNEKKVSKDALRDMAKCFPSYSVQHRMGWGDLSILSECVAYRKRVKKTAHVTIWSLDTHLNNVENFDDIKDILSKHQSMK
jgi:hypothetical protein